jgi:adenosine deaminase
MGFTTVKDLPKIDLHRHLEGSLRLQTLYEIALEYDLGISVAGLEQLRPYVQVTNDPAHHEAFLRKFEVLRHFYRSPETISRLAYEAVADAAADNVKYLELRFSPQALSRVRGFSLGEVTDWVITAVQQASHDYDIDVGLIITLVRHDPLQQAQEVAEVAFDRFSKGIIGLDLAGNEVKFPSTPFTPLFKEAKKIGMGVTVHAGEWASAHGVAEAIEELCADRIGHGIRTIENSRVLRLVREREIALEVCLTSNLQTGVVHNLAHHPLVDMLDLGMKATLNTDDPSVSNVTLTNEYEVALNVLQLNYPLLRQVVLNAAHAAFLPDDERAALVAKFELWLPPTFSDNGRS